MSAQSSPHGTTRSISARNCARRVVLENFSNPEPASVICLLFIVPVLFVERRGAVLQTSKQRTNFRDSLGRRPHGKAPLPRRAPAVRQGAAAPGTPPQDIGVGARTIRYLT